ncbi:unnamed protein product [Protopolystoma xenopodis]|uniref:Uncharacterized protein n=1 Tax=Protopolystoma xenopodis TaxID=117903 RepID=A0A3S4ZAQ6_9PLAT|nr:unnamed protein product [Protopolystoma xenopodis]
MLGLLECFALAEVASPASSNLTKEDNSSGLNSSSENRRHQNHHHCHHNRHIRDQYYRTYHRRHHPHCNSSYQDSQHNYSGHHHQRHPCSHRPRNSHRIQKQDKRHLSVPHYQAIQKQAVGKQNFYQEQDLTSGVKHQISPSSSVLMDQDPKNKPLSDCHKSIINSKNRTHLMNHSQQISYHTDLTTHKRVDSKLTDTQSPVTASLESVGGAGKKSAASSLWKSATSRTFHAITNLADEDLCASYLPWIPVVIEFANL